MANTEKSQYKATDFKSPAEPSSSPGSEHNEILKTVKLITDDEVNIPEKTDLNVVPEATVGKEMSEDEVRQWTELLDYAE